MQHLVDLDTMVSTFYLVVCKMMFIFYFGSGHGSFSDNRMLNNVMGHVLLTFVLTPFHGL